MNRKKVKFLAIAGMMMALSCGSLLCGNGIVSYEGETDGLTDLVEARDQLFELETPEVEGVRRRNCITTYKVTQVDPEASVIEYYSGGSDRYPFATYSNMGEGASTMFAGTVSTSTGYAAPSVFVIRARDIPGGNKISLSTTIGNMETKKPLYPVERTVTTGTLGTAAPNTPGWRWQNTFDSEVEKVYFSLLYAGEYYEGSVTINESDHTSVFIPGKGSFYFYVRENYVSICAGFPIVFNSYDTVFAYSASDYAQ